MYHGWCLYFQGQKGHIKARWATFWPLFKNFSENSQGSILKVQEFLKKVFWKNVPRLPAFKTTLSFKINFLWSYPLEFNQIQIMWLFWLKLHFHQKILAFKGREGQERPCNFFQHSLAVINFIAKSFFFKNMQLLFSKKSRPPSPFGSTLLQHGLPGL